jgi:hypothetical protein
MAVQCTAHQLTGETTNAPDAETYYATDSSLPCSVSSNADVIG